MNRKVLKIVVGLAMFVASVGLSLGMANATILTAYVNNAAGAGGADNSTCGVTATTSGANHPCLTVEYAYNTRGQAGTTYQIKSGTYMVSLAPTGATTTSNAGKGATSTTGIIKKSYFNAVDGVGTVRFIGVGPLAGVPTASWTTHTGGPNGHYYTTPWTHTVVNTPSLVSGSPQPELNYNSGYAAAGSAGCNNNTTDVVNCLALYPDQVVETVNSSGTIYETELVSICNPTSGTVTLPGNGQFCMDHVNNVLYIGDTPSANNIVRATIYQTAFRFDTGSSASTITGINTQYYAPTWNGQAETVIESGVTGVTISDGHDSFSSYKSIYSLANSGTDIEGMTFTDNAGGGISGSALTSFTINNNSFGTMNCGTDTLNVGGPTGTCYNYLNTGFTDWGVAPWWNTDEDAAAIKITGGSSSCGTDIGTVEGNAIYGNVGGMGIWFDTNVCAVLVEGNTIGDITRPNSAGTGLQLEGVSNSLAYQNAMTGWDLDGAHLSNTSGVYFWNNALLANSGYVATGEPTITGRNLEVSDNCPSGSASSSGNSVVNNFFAEAAGAATTITDLMYVHVNGSCSNTASSMLSNGSDYNDYLTNFGSGTPDYLDPTNVAGLDITTGTLSHYASVALMQAAWTGHEAHSNQYTCANTNTWCGPTVSGNLSMHDVTNADQTITAAVHSLDNTITTGTHPGIGVNWP